MRLVTRKIKKGLYGLATPSFNNIGNAFSNAVKPNLNFLSQMGDMTALSLVTNQNLGQGANLSKSTLSSYIDLVSGDTNNASMSPALGMAGLFLGSMYDTIPSLDKTYNSNDLLSSDIRGGASKALLSGAAGPWGMLAGAGLLAFDKTGGFTDASKGLGGANDALNMIASVAIPGAGWFTKRTMNYNVSDTLQLNSASYGGTLDKANTAEQNAGAKLLFGRGRANNMIGNAILADNKVLNIMAENEIAQAGANNPFINLRNQFNLSGGWQLGTITFGRLGLKLSPNESNTILHKVLPTEILLINCEQVEEYKDGGSIIELITIPTEISLTNPDNILEFLDGGSIPDKLDIKTISELTFDTWYNMIPKDKRDTTNYNLRRAFELAPKEELLDFINIPDSHLRTFYYNLNGVGEFMKSKNHPTLWMELEYYNNGNQVINKDGKDVIVPADKKEWELFRKNYDLDTSEEYYKYIPKNLEAFEKGGSINVIPDGALHARKHNMDIEGITKKGIPVISNNGELLAEIELNEIIFRLEVTKKLEELLKIFYNEESSNKEKEDAALEAGKLLTQEILYNTLDNTGLLEQIN